MGSFFSFWGGAAFLGLLTGGSTSDRFGPGRVIATALPLMSFALISLPVSATYLIASKAFVPVLAAVVIWGSAAWGFFPAQQASLIGVAGLSNSAIVLSLNASFMYFGFSLGAGLGSLTLVRSGATRVGGIFVLAALALFVATGRMPRRTAERYLATRS